MTGINEHKVQTLRRKERGKIYWPQSSVYILRKLNYMPSTSIQRINLIMFDLFVPIKIIFPLRRVKDQGNNFPNSIIVIVHL